jgi:Ni/Fe-hydrogenase subunit HybB-like protein
VLLGLAALGGALVLWRFLVGLGRATALNDGYPWGIWIALDVVTGTALACGGYAVALLVYVFNRGHYHPLVRPAILTSALGYSMAAVTITFDVGRPWIMPWIPLKFWHWNLNSALLEVALCVMAYIVVLWIELSPAFLERWAAGERPLLRRTAERLLPILDRALVFIVALGLLLPTMHQSSLGTVMLLAGRKVHPLWSTPLLPLLFLVSCLAMGVAVVVFESALSSVFFRRKAETAMLGSLSRAAVVAAAVFLAVRLLDLALRGRLGLLWSPKGLLVAVETALFLAPALMILDRERSRRLGWLFRAAVLLMLAGTVYRVDTYLVAFDPGPGWSYFPAVPEMLMTVGVVAAEVFAYVAIVKNYPILGGSPAAARP